MRRKMESINQEINRKNICSSEKKIDNRVIR